MDDQTTIPSSRVAGELLSVFQANGNCELSASDSMTGHGFLITIKQDQFYGAAFRAIPLTQLETHLRNGERIYVGFTRYFICKSFQAEFL